jgi:tripartite-type tricarboxylate transporter receptor subunit TctC
MKKFMLIVCFIAVFLTFGLKTSLVQAQPYPSRTITLVIPMVAGAAMDGVGRILADELGKILNQPVIVMNKPGASTTLGTDFVVKSKKDGYTFLLANTSSVIYSKIADPKLVPYDSLKDLEPLGLYCFFPFVLAVRPDAQWGTFAELVDYAKKNPGKVRVCTAGQMSTAHFGLEVIQHMTGAQFTHIPHKGNIELFLLGGNVEALFNTATLSIPHMEAGKMRFLLLSKKMVQYPKIPTITELGYKEDVPSAWLAFFAPAGVPEEVKKVLTPAIEKAAKNSEIKAKIEKMGFIVDYKSPIELKKLLEKEYTAANEIAVRIGYQK